jgi:flavorubredoxin
MNEVIIPFVSMHGSVAKMVHILSEELIKKDITVKPFNLTHADIGEIAMALVDAATVVIASSTVLAGAHPKVASVAYLLNALRPKTKFATIIGSYGWGGKMSDDLIGMLSNLKAEMIPPLIIKGYPKEEDFHSLERLADKIFQKHKNL